MGPSGPIAPDAWLDYQAERALLLDIRDRVIRITQFGIDGLVALGQAGPSSYGLRKAAALQELVMAPLQRREYRQAQDGLYEFLSDDLMLRIMERLINHASPGIDLLADFGGEYDV